MILKRIFRGKEPRKYPIKRNSSGKSLRERCFRLFDEGMRPVEVARELGMKEATAKRYFQQWKQLGPDFDKHYAFAKGLFERSAPDRERNIELFARAWGITKEGLESVLSQPHGLRRLMSGKLHFPGQANAKRHIALEVAIVISDHLIKNGGKTEDVLFAFNRLMQERKKYRKEVDAEIEEENQEIAFIRQVLEAADEVEREGREKPAKLTPEEQQAIMRYGLKAKMVSMSRDLETRYWFRVGELMGEGLTQWQAREKIYRDLFEKDDVDGAKKIRIYQDTVHPLKAEGQNPTSSTSESP